MTINGLNHKINYSFEKCTAKKAGVDLGDQLCRHYLLQITKVWHKPDYLNNYSDLVPKLHQILQPKSVKVKLFQCFSWAMYRDNSCNGFCNEAEQTFIFAGLI